MEKGELETCFGCGAEITHEGNSLHCWDIVYECGCRILGAISDGIIYVDKFCKNIQYF